MALAFYSCNFFFRTKQNVSNINYGALKTQKKMKLSCGYFRKSIPLKYFFLAIKGEIALISEV